MKALTIKDIDAAIEHLDGLIGEIDWDWDNYSPDLQAGLAEERRHARTAIRALSVTRRQLTETEASGAHKPAAKTRGDAIRAMDDRQLATYLYSVDGSGLKFCPDKVACGELIDTPGGIPESDCMTCLAEWLGQPPEGSGEHAHL